MTANADRYSTFHDRITIVLGFLGAVVFAGLVLVLQEPDFILKSSILASELSPNSLIPFLRNPEGYFQLVITYLACLSSVCAIVCLVSVRASSGYIKTKEGQKFLKNFVENGFDVIFAGFIFALGLLIFPETLYGTPVFLAFTLAVFSVFAFPYVIHIFLQRARVNKKDGNPDT